MAGEFPHSFFHECLLGFVVEFSDDTLEQQSSSGSNGARSSGLVFTLKQLHEELLKSQLDRGTEAN